MALERFGLRATTLKFKHPDVYLPGGEAAGSRQQRHEREQQQQGQQAVACAPGGDCYPVAVTEVEWEDASDGSTAAAGRAAAPLRLPVGHLSRPYEALPGDERAAEELLQWEGAAASAAGAAAAVRRPATRQPQPSAAAAQQGEQHPAVGMQRWGLQQLWRRDQKQQQQAQQAVLAGGVGKRQLAWQHAAGERGSGSGTADYSWDVTAKCWAVGVARHFGGELAAVRVADWLL